MKLKYFLIVYLILLFAQPVFSNPGMVGIKDSSGTNEHVAMNLIPNSALNNRLGNSNIYIWPNPVTDKMTVYINSLRDGDGGQCVVLNNFGIPVLQHYLNNGTNNIYMGKLASGWYIVKILTNSNEIYSGKIIVNQ